MTQMIIIMPEALDSYDEALLNFLRYLEPEKIATAGVKDWVSICPKVTSRGVNRVVIAQLIDLYKDSLLCLTPAYDGRKDLYTAGHLPFESKEFVIKLVDRDVHTKSASYVPVGRSFFSTPYCRTDSLGDGLECWRGFYQSIRPTQMGLSLNIVMSQLEDRFSQLATVGRIVWVMDWNVGEDFIKAFGQHIWDCLLILVCCARKVVK